LKPVSPRAYAFRRPQRDRAPCSRRPPMRLVAPLLAVLLALAAPLPTRATEIPPETVVGPLGDLTCPVLALDPITHEPHVAYVSEHVLYHAWRAGGTWQTEVVALSVSGDAVADFDGFDLKMTPDGRP